MADVVVLLYKERTKAVWSYVHGNTRYSLDANGPLLEQLVHVITHIRDTHDLYDENVVICSTAFVKSIFYDLTLIFPMIKFIPVKDAEIARIFHKVMERSAVRSRGSMKGDTLFVCSDASKGGTGSLAGWAWFSSASDKKSYNFGVSEHHSIVDAEFEGILHAIVDNANTRHKTIRVYCDSMRSVEFAQAMLEGKLHTLKVMENKKILKLMDVVLEVAKVKNVQIQWVKGHRSHRLNVGADFLSRQARVVAEKRQRLAKTDQEVVAIMSLFP